jgi:hypothetical protein
MRILLPTLGHALAFIGELEHPELFGGDRRTGCIRVPDLAVPTLAHGESWRDVRDVTIDAAAVGARGMGYERLDQPALEHLYGIR